MRAYHHRLIQQFTRLVGAAAFALTMTAAYAENGVTKDEIVFGQSTALTGPLAELGVDSSLASKAYFDHINEQGGVNGRKIRLITLDDAYNVQKSLENTKTLIEKEKVFALFNMFGTPANIALLPVVTQAGIPSIAPYTGSDAVRTPFNRLIFNVRAGYVDEIEKIVEHLVIRGIDKVAVVHQNNAFGNDGLISVVEALAKRQQTLHASASIENDASDADKAAQKLVASKPKAVVLITSGKPSSEFIKSYNQLIGGMQFFTLSVMGSQTSVAALGKAGSGVVVAQVMPFPFSATSGIVREYQQVMKKMGVKNLSFASMEGFMNAKVVVEGLKRANRDVTRENFVTALESIGKLDLDGYIINLTRASHLGSRYVDLTVISRDGRFIR